MWPFTKKDARQSDLMRSATVSTAKGRPVWPDTTPPDKSDPNWEFNNNLNCNGTAYKKKEVEPGRWQWVIDDKAMRRKAEHQGHLDDLVWALRSRVLSDAEMVEVKSRGIHLLIREMVPYYEEEVSRQFNDLLLQQFSPQLAARQNQGDELAIRNHATPAKEPE